MKSIRVSDLRQFTFCQRVLFHRVVMGQPTRETHKMKMGREAEAVLARLEKRRGLRRYHLERAARRFDVQLASERLGLHGLCDLVLERPATSDGDATAAQSFPVEIKTTRGGVGRHHVLQLAAYAMLLEDHGAAPVENGFVLLLPEDRAVVVPIGEAERAAVVETAAAVRRLYEERRFPEPTRFRSFCPDCEYVNFCGDVL